MVGLVLQDGRKIQLGEVMSDANSNQNNDELLRQLRDCSSEPNVTPSGVPEEVLPWFKTSPSTAPPQNVSKEGPLRKQTDPSK
jgi:hypothetical protein